MIKSSRYEDRRLRLLAERALGSSILDLGYAQSPNPYLQHEIVTGVDLNISESTSGYEREIQGSVMDLEELLSGEQFSTIIAGELIEHLERPYDFLRICKKMLSPDSRLLLSTPNPIAFPTLLMEATRTERFFYTREHTYYIAPRWVKRMLDLTGFELLEICPVGLWLPGTLVPWCPIWLSYQLIYTARPREA